MAHWKVEDLGFGGTKYTCSECGYLWNDLFYVCDVEYCPNCGAHMVGGNEYVDEKPKKQTKKEKIIKKFVEYLKEHACNYDFSDDLSNCSYHSFRGIDTDDLDDMAEDFLKTIYEKKNN